MYTLLLLLLSYIAGEVVHADILTLPNGKSKGCGIVEYSNPQEAEQAVEKLSNLTLNGRPIFVREDRESENKVATARPPRFTGGRSSGGSDPTQVYVSNIPYSVTWKGLKDLFKIAGAVIRCDIFQSQGRSKGTGVVLYESSADASNAIAKLNGYEFHGRPLEVRLDKFYRPENFNARSSRFGGNSPRFNARPGNNNGFAGFNPTPVKKSPFTDRVTGNGPVSDTIFVSNLPWATTDRDLVELFQSVATVKQAEIQLESNGRSAGAGVVQFDTPASAHIAVEKLSGYNYGNRPLTISFATYPPDADVSNTVVPTAPSTAGSAAPAAAPAASATPSPVASAPASLEAAPAAN